jgi:hypothetical protein
MTRYGLLCLLLGALAWGQANTQSTPAPQTPAAPAGAAGQNTLPQAADVPPDTPVITISGICPNSATAKNPADCKTVITREQFEKMVDAVQPGMPARMRRQFATRYANALVMSEKGEQMGLDKGPDYDEHMKLARMQVLSQELNKTLQEKAGEISDKDLEDYYHANISKFETADLERVYIPKTQQAPEGKADEKLSDADEKKRTEAGEAAMKAEADKLHTQAAAGTAFSKLQEQAFQTAGIKSGAPSTDMQKMRRSMLPADQATVLDLKTGEISSVITDQNGYFIYRLKTKETIPFDQAKDEIKGSLRSQRFQDSMKAIQEASAPVLDDKYFGAVPPMPQRPGQPPIPPPKPAGTKPN